MNGFLATVALAGIASRNNLTPAPWRQDHTTSPSAFSALVRSTVNVHRIPPRVRDDREPPLEWSETARVMGLIWVKREEEYF